MPLLWVKMYHCTGSELASDLAGFNKLIIRALCALCMDTLSLMTQLRVTRPAIDLTF